MESDKPETTPLSASGSAPSVTVNYDLQVAEEAPPAPKLPKLPKKGVYVLQEGDTPGVVSQKLFGRGNRAVELVRANMDVVWDVGSEITIP